MARRSDGADGTAAGTTAGVTGVPEVRFDFRIYGARPGEGVSEKQLGWFFADDVRRERERLGVEGSACEQAVCEFEVRRAFTGTVADLPETVGEARDERLGSPEEASAYVSAHAMPCSEALAVSFLAESGQFAWLVGGLCPVSGSGGDAE